MSFLKSAIDWLLNSQKARKENNDWVKDRMRLGHKLFAVVPPEATWWPPREIIKKDENALEFFKKERKHLRLVIDNTKK